MQVAKDFPCKVCGHAANKHYITVCDGDGVCTGCTDRQRTAYDNEQFHDFVGDNLAYMELQKKKQELLNE